MDYQNQEYGRKKNQEIRYNSSDVGRCSKIVCFIYAPLSMRLHTKARKKLRQALVRVEKVVIMDIRKQLDQQRKWKAEVVKRQARG